MSISRVVALSGLTRLAVLMGVAEDEEGRSRLEVIRRTLNTLGWTEGRNLQIDVRWLGAELKRAPALAKELVESNPSVIVTNSTISTLAARDATKTIPIVFVQLGLNDPISLGFADSIAKPGKNITGFLNFEGAIVSKWLQLMTEIAPNVRRVGCVAEERFFTPGAPEGSYLSLLEKAGPSFNLEIEPIPMKEVSRIHGSIQRFAERADGALVVLPSIFHTVNRAQLIAAAQEYKLPALYPYNYFARDGGLISYGVDLPALYRGVASYVDRILRGSTVGDLPIQTPSKFQLCLNLATAKKLGLAFPTNLIVQADEVIDA